MRLGVVDDVQSTLPTVAPPQQLERTGGVRVKGVGDLLVRFAKCCHPIPGDPIVGFITRGKGVTVHLQTCPTVINEREVSRLIEVEWEAAPTETYPIAIRVEAYDRTGLLSDITQVVAENKVNIVAAHVGVTPDHTAVVTATLQVALGLAAGPGHGPHRDAQGRHLGPARPRLTGRSAMPTFKSPRGTRDLLPPETATWTRLERLAADLAARYGYRRIETPLFELTDVFERGVGEVTDIVEKELFRLAPRTDEGESWALRPEPTAGIVRAYIQHGMQTWPQPVKLTETGPMFRYDRPQAGRYRQFWQWDIEAIGDPGPAIDAEIVELASRFYRDAGLEGVVVHLNSIGDATCRPAYVERADRVLPGPPRRPARTRARPTRAQRPAPARFEGSGDGAVNAAGPEDHRPPVRGMHGALRRRSRPPRRAGRALPTGAGARPWPRLLHPDRVRVLRRRS